MGNEVSHSGGSKRHHKDKDRDDKSHKSSKSHKPSKPHSSKHHHASKSANKEHSSSTPNRDHAKSSKDQAKADKAKAKAEKEKAEKRMRAMYTGCSYKSNEPKPPYIRLKQYDKNAISSASREAANAMERDFEKRLREDPTFDITEHPIWKTMTKKEKERFKGLLDEEGRPVLRKREREKWKKGELGDSRALGWEQEQGNDQDEETFEEQEQHQEVYEKLSGGEGENPFFQGSSAQSEQPEESPEGLPSTDEVSNDDDNAGEGRAPSPPSSEAGDQMALIHMGYQSSPEPEPNPPADESSSPKSSSQKKPTHKSSSSKDKGSSHKSLSGNKSSSHKSSSRKSRK